MRQARTERRRMQQFIAFIVRLYDAADMPVSRIKVKGAKVHVYTRRERSGRPIHKQTKG